MRRLAWLRARVPTLFMALGLLACADILTAPDGGADLRPRSMQVTPQRLDLRVGDTARMTASLFALTGTATAPEAGRKLSYSAADPLVATVDAQGLVTATGGGTTTVRAEYGALALGIQVAVSVRPRIDVVAGSAQVAEQGDTLADSLVVRAVDGMKAPLMNTVLDVSVISGGGSSSSQVVTDTNGIAKAQWHLGTTLGPQTLKVTRPGSDSALFVASATPGTRPMRVALVLGRLLLVGAGDTTQLSARAWNVVDSLLPAATFTWRSSTDSVATVSQTGVVTSVAPGTAFIVVRSGVALDSTSITVQAPPTPTPDTVIVSIAIDARTTQLQAGDTLTLIAEAFNVANTVIPGVVFAWSGGDPVVATIDPATGIVTAIGSGTTRFTATSAGVSGSVDITIGTVAVLPKLGLGADIEQPAGLQSERAVSIPQQAVNPFDVTVRTLDATGAVVARTAAIAGSASAAVEMEAVTSSTSYWLQAIEGTAGRSVTLIAEAPGYAPDTMVVTLVQPAFRLSGVGSAGVPIPAAGGPDPVMVVSVGYSFGDGDYEPMAVRIGGTPPSFTLTSTTPALALLRFVAGGGVVGENQGPQAQVTFGIAPGTNSTSNGQFSEANLLLARTGAGGTAIVTIAGPAEYEALIPGLSYNLTTPALPRIGVNPEQLGFTVMAGEPAPAVQTIEITNTGSGDLTGLGAEVAYGAGASDWIALSFSATTAPAVVTLTPATQVLTPGSYTAMVTFTSTVQGVNPVHVVVTLEVKAPPPPPTLTLALVNTPLIGVSGTALLRVTLPDFAPVGGVDVSLVSGNTSRATVNAPATVRVAEGATVADFIVTGVTTGTVQLTASAAGYTDGTLDVTVSTNTISVPLTLNVPYTRTASLPISLTMPAPAGGVLITISSGNPGIVGVVTTSVLIPAGTFSGNAQLEGVTLGQVAVTATGPNLATGTSLVRVTAALDIVESGVTINQGFSTASLTTRLLSGGAVFPAPAGGVPLSWVSRNPACIAAPAGLSVAPGLNSVATVADYGGTAPTPCTTYLVVTSPSFDPDSVSITVNPPPTSGFGGAQSIAAGLTRAQAIFLGAATPAGGTEVVLTSSDPSRLVLAPDATTVGTPTLTLNVPPGVSVISFYYAAIEDQVGDVQITATVQRYSAPTPSTVTILPLGLEAFVFTPTMTTIGGDGAGTVVLGALSAAGPNQSVSGETILRPGGQTLTVTLSSTTPEVAVPFVGGVAASPATLTIGPGQSRANFPIRPLVAGTTTFTATAPGATPPVRNGYPGTVTVNTPVTSFSISPSIGAGLSRQATIFAGAAAPPGGTVITLTSSNPARLLLSPNLATVGTASIDLTIPAGASSASFTTAGVEGQAGTADIIGVVQGAPPPYSNPNPVTVTVRPLGIELFNFTPTMTTLGGDGSGTVTLGELSDAGPNQSVSGETQIRAGGPTVTITLTSTTAATAVPLVGGVAATPATLTIGPGQSRANYGIRPLAAGTTTFQATSPDAASPVRANYPGTITINQPTTSFSVSTNIAAGLARQATVFLGAPAPAGGTIMTLTSSDPSRLVLAPNLTTVGTATIDITIPAGSSSASFTNAGIEGQAGTATITGTVQGVPAPYSNPTPVVVTVDPLGLEAFNFTPNLTTLASDGVGTVTLGSLGPAGPNQGVSGETQIRAGGQQITITLTSTTPTVAVPVVNGVAASPATLTIDPGSSRVNYGIRQLVAGTTTFAATSPSAAAPVRANYPGTITVSSPGMTISLGTTVGAGLTAQGTLFFGTAIPAGGSTVTLTSSDPARVLLAPDLTTAGTAQITIPVNQGVSAVSFAVMGLEDVTGNPTVTAQSPGYTDASAPISVQPIGVQWSGSTSLTTVGGDGFGNVSIGVMTGVPGNRTVSPQQSVRFGGVARTVTLTSSNPAVALPLVTGTAQQGMTVTILPGASSATAGVRPVGAGTTTIGASGPGLLSAESPGFPQLVTVTVATQSLSIGSTSQGAGLSQNGTLFLQSPVPAGGRTLTLTSNTPGRLLLAPDATSTGTAQLSFDLPAGTSSRGFTIMGLEGVTGSAGVTATISGFRDTTFTFTVVQPGVTLDGPPTTAIAGQADIVFHAQVGVPSGAAVLAQAVRFGAPAPLTVTLTSSAPAIGTLVVNGVTASPRTVSIPVGQNASNDVPAERAHFRALSAGNSTITATIPGYQQQGNAIRTVTVSP